MGLFLTPAQIAVSRLSIMSEALYNQMVRTSNNGYSTVWENATASPSQMIEAMGTSAQGFFAAQNLNNQNIIAAATLLGITPPEVQTIPDAYTLTFNSDGSATLADVPPADSLSGGAK